MQEKIGDVGNIGTSAGKPKPEIQKPVKPEAAKPKEAGKPERRIENIIRLAETNLDGERPVNVAIRSIKGVGFMFSNVVAKASGFGSKKLGELSQEEQKKLEDIINNPQKYNIPLWLFNRKRDPITGKAMHLAASRLELMTKTDINEMKKIRCYKGVRHSLGLPVRGQRTRSSFRKNKTVGVRREKIKKGKV